MSSQIDELLGKQKEEAEKCPPISMSAAAVGCGDLEGMQAMLESREYCAPSRLDLLRSMLTVAPPPEKTPELAPGTRVWERPEPQMPSWAVLMGWHRVFFDACAVVFTKGGTTQYWKIVYCVQSPRPYMAVCRLAPTDAYNEAAPHRSSSSQDLSAASYDMAFRCNFGIMATAADLPPLEMDEISVLFALKHVGGVMVVARGAPIPLRVYMAGKATPAHCHPEKPKEAVLDKEFEEIVLDMPWLKHLDASDSFIQNAAAAASDSQGSGWAAELPLLEVDEEEVFAALAAVDKARIAEAGIAMERGSHDFHCKENCGESNLRKGKAFHDACQGHCATNEADKWARQRNLHVTFKGTFSEHNEQPARILVRAWVHRMQYFYDYERAHGGEDFEFNAGIVRTYCEPDELTRLAATSDKTSTLKRIEQIRRLPFK